MLIWGEDRAPESAPTAVPGAVVGERRAHPRVAVRLPGLLCDGDGQWEIWTDNASAGGVLVATTAQLPVGRQCHLWLFTPDGELTTGCVVLWTTPGRLALQFEAQLSAFPLQPTNSTGTVIRAG